MGTQERMGACLCKQWKTGASLLESRPQTSAERWREAVFCVGGGWEVDVSAATEENNPGNSAA